IVHSPSLVTEPQGDAFFAGLDLQDRVADFYLGTGLLSEHTDASRLRDRFGIAVKHGSEKVALARLARTALGECRGLHNWFGMRIPGPVALTQRGVGREDGFGSGRNLNAQRRPLLNEQQVVVVQAGLANAVPEK